ncbi:MAG: DUF2791 family P-loop domain-containing protein [Chloroflexi bacterium]|nr:DUF2791 family P-loop domain-containing protein [Chloroflexota bacterium]
MITPSSVKPQIASWRAVEALRAGVPNSDAVQALGCSHPLVEERFRSMLAEIDLGFSRGEGTQGVLVAGDFGSGKSHLLEYFQHIALENNFVCSKVVVSKETPLYGPSKVYAAAVQAAKVPNRSGTLLAAIAEDLDFESPEYEDFYRWVFSSRTVLNSRFAASTFVFERGSGGRYPDVSDRILQFWAGARVPATELRSWLKELGEVAAYKFEKVSELVLSLQRYEFMSRLIRATGYAGWVILVDEVELIGRYSVMQRAKSYAEMSRLLGLSEDDRTPGLSTVFAITSAYQSEVMDQKQDEEKIALKLRDRGKPGDQQLSEKAELGMRKIRQLPLENMILAENFDLREVHEKSRVMYRQAYGWNPPEDYETNPTWRIRQHIKRWINAWDLVRLYPDYQPDIQVSGLRQSYSEDLDLEDPWDEEGEDPAVR